MPKALDPFCFLLISVAGQVNQEQQHAIAYLREESRILRAHLGARWICLKDEQLRSLAANARLLGKKLLADIATVDGGLNKGSFEFSYSTSLRRRQILRRNRMFCQACTAAKSTIVAASEVKKNIVPNSTMP